MDILRRFRLSLLPVLALSGIAIATAVSVGCSNNAAEDQGMTEDRITNGADYGYGYGYGDDGYGYGYGYYGN